MLRRFFQSLGSEPPAEGGPTYGESLLDQALDPVRDAGGDDIIGALATAIVSIEEAAGLEPAPKAELARDQFTRTYATLVLDNDRYAPSLQMSADDLRMPRRLLQSFFTGSATMQADAQTVLRFIEERFSSGLFGQARLLLQLFDTDPGTRRNNERNLFYEEMIVRFLSERPGELPSLDAEGDFTAKATALRETRGVQLHTYSYDGARDADWEALWPSSSVSGAFATPRPVPGPRWRPHWEERDVVECITEQFEYRGVREFVENLTRCVYFVTLAPGATGFEHLVVRYMEWMGDHFSYVPTRLLPRLHRSSTLGEVGISEAFAAIWDELEPKDTTVDEAFSDKEIREAVDAVINAFCADDVDVPRGEYDLGGIVAMRLFGFDAGDTATALRIHRLT